MLSGHNLLTYVGWILVAVTWFLLYKTKLGLNIRAVGENEEAAQSAGINVLKTRFISLVFCGVFCALGGMYLSMGSLKPLPRYGGGQRIPVSGDAGHQPGQSGGGLFKLAALWIF